MNLSPAKPPICAGRVNFGGSYVTGFGLSGTATGADGAKAEANSVRRRGAEVLRRLSRMVEAGDLWAPVQATLPLEEAARAQEMLQHGHVRGKLVLTVA